jgi:YD repeat-containing protein
MQKIIIATLLSAVTAVPALSSANPHHAIHGGTMSTYRGHNSISYFKHLPQQRVIAAKSTAVDARLISMTDLSYNGSTYDANDSTTYSYTGSRGGVLDTDWLEWMWKSDVSYHYNYDGFTSMYDPADTKVSYAYDASDNIISETDQVWNSTTSTWENSWKYVYTYDASGNVIADTSFTWDGSGSVWDYDTYSIYTYSATNKLISVLQQQWSTGMIAWENVWQSIISRDASDRMSVMEGQYWDGTSWVNEMRQNYTYDGSGNRTSEMNEYWSGAAYDTSGINLTSSFATSHQPLVSVFMDWDTASHAFVNSYRSNYTYTTYGKPDYFYDETWDESTSAWVLDYSSAIRYHYEEYGGTTGVDKLVAQNNDVVLYPVPAIGQVTVETKWDKAQPFTVSITDVCGKTFTTWSVAATKDYQETFSVTELPAGNYVLTLRGGQGSVSKQFSVVR